MVGTVVGILMQIGTSLLTKKVVSEIVASLIEWAVKSSKTPVDDKIAAPIIEVLRK